MKTHLPNSGNLAEGLTGQDSRMREMNYFQGYCEDEDGDKWCWHVYQTMREKDRLSVNFYTHDSHFAEMADEVLEDAEVGIVDLNGSEPV